MVEQKHNHGYGTPGEHASDQGGVRHGGDQHGHGPGGHARSSSGQIAVGILTASDRGARGERADVSGPTIHNLVVDRLGARVAQYRVVPDDRAAIEETLIEWVDVHRLDLILTTGGTGFSPRDVTPEATRAVIERETPALTQAMLFESLRITPYAMLTRATAGIRKSTLIVNLPGNPKAVTENFDAIAEVLPHAIDIVRGVDTHARQAQQAGAAHAGHLGHGAGHGGHRAEHDRRDDRASHAGYAAPRGHDVRAGSTSGTTAGRQSTSGIARNVGGPTC